MFNVVISGGSNLRTAVPTISPQSQARMGTILLPGVIPVAPHFEASMVSVVIVLLLFKI